MPFGENGSVTGTNRLLSWKERQICHLSTFQPSIFSKYDIQHFGVRACTHVHVRVCESVCEIQKTSIYEMRLYVMRTYHVACGNIFFLQYRLKSPL